MSWDWSFTLKILPDLMIGVWYTVVVTALSSIVALIVGLVFAIIEDVSTSFRLFVRFWLELFRGVPIVVLLYIGFFLLPQGGLTLSAMTVGVLVFGTVYAAYSSEVYRGSLITIPKGLHDACHALHLSSYVRWRRILVPLMVKRSAPVLFGYVIGMFRESALMFTIGVPVLMAQAHDVAFQHARYLEPFTMAGLIYTLLNMPLLYILSKHNARYV
ncbi:amino acid ABC transporter permease [Bradyrhizobium sp. USDA 4451]